MSRESILKHIAMNKPSEKSLLNPWKKGSKIHENNIGNFITVAKSSGAEVMDLDSFDKMIEWIEQQKKHQKSIIDLVQNSEELLSSEMINEPEMVIISGQFGVAENGAVWLDENDMQVRKLPFLANHLVIVLKKENILTDMHEAYALVDLANIGFGVFIAGPSKTADIEQALVIGAHGPVKHTILIF